MRLPSDLLSGTYTRPRLFLCEVDKTRICQLDPIDYSGVFKFNTYSEIEFSIGRTYEDTLSGERKVHPFYDKIEALRLVYVEGFGYFEIQDPNIESDGIMEVKNVTAYSLEYTLAQKYLENLYINTGNNDSIEVMYAQKHGLSKPIPVTLYNDDIEDLSLLNIILEKVYGWHIAHVDPTLATMSRQFDVSRASVYDFLTQDICDSFGCYIVFDTIEREDSDKQNVVRIYSESLITKFRGDGHTKEFTVSARYSELYTVSIGGYKTTDWTYDPTTGKLTFTNPPAKDTIIEVIDGAQEKWVTDTYISFENLAQEVEISYSADDIKTVLTVKGADDLDIREVNCGLPYIVDLSYYHSVEWMGQELYDAYNEYLSVAYAGESQYIENSKKMLELNGRMDYDRNRLSLEYSQATVNSETIGEYYLRGGSEPYYYTKVVLPESYNINLTYFSIRGNDLNEEKFSLLYKALQAYYYSQNQKNTSKLEELKSEFNFVNTEFETLISELKNANSTSKDNAVKTFLSKLWEQLGVEPLKSLYKAPYEAVKEVNIKAGWNIEGTDQYWNHYPVEVILASIDETIIQKNNKIEEYQKEYNELAADNNNINKEALVDNYFNTYYPDQAKKMLMRLSAFLREDEYTDDNFVETSADTTESLMKLKKELLECGRIELSKLCEPKLEFSMDMANIYALKEFEQIVDQFQLGKLINVAIRGDYIKRARLLEVNINFNDFSDFSCEFGELTDRRTPSSIHADLLASAMQAGKSVASSASYWKKGADLATSTDLKIQEGLLDAIGGLYSSTQGVRIDKDGIWLTKINADGTVSPNQARIVNNTILFSSDGFETARTGLGEFTIDGEPMYGLLAEAVLSGYIEGSTIVGGEIKIGDNFHVYNDGIMNSAGGVIAGWEINQNRLTKEITLNDMNYQMYLQAADGALNSHAFAVNSKEADTDTWDTQFSVDYKGKLIAKNAEITGEITATKLTLSEDATISGKISATTGSIAGWDIETNAFKKELDKNDSTYQVYMQAPDGADYTDAFVVKKKDNETDAWDVRFTVDYEGKLTAKDADITGTITATDGSIAGYNIGSGGSYDNAIYKRVSNDNTQYEVGLKSTNGATDLAFYVKKSTDAWESSSNVFYVNNSGKLYATSVEITGNGTIGGCTMTDGVLSVDAANIKSGTIDSARVGNLNASKITAGTFSADRIPNLSANKITSGTIDASVVTVTNLNASNITSGTISTGVLSSSVITTNNFSSKTLSTGNLSVTNGGNIGLWTVNSNNYLYAISGNYGVSLSATAVSHGQGGSTTWVNIVKAGQNASDERLKKNISGFDNKFDVIFDSLRPVQFEYSKDFLGHGIHFGYIAQDVIKSFEDNGEDVNKYSFVYETEIEDNSEDKYYQLNHSNFIALNTWQIQKLKARVDELEKRLAALEA